jgi:Putative amidoligase enzyme
VSPILWATPGSKWREDVEAVWRHLRRYYTINTNDDCATHVHISIIPWYSWGEVKRIAQAAIHFEPAFEVLVPSARRGNKFAKSLWLDSPWLVAKNYCRAELMDSIEKADFLDALLPLIQDGRDYCWNFLPLFDRGTIEFRKPPASTTAEEALSWAELAMSFVQACIRCKSTVELKKVPATVGGLRWFCSQSLETGVNQPHRLQRIWADHDEKEALKPVPVTKGDMSNEWTQRTKRILNMKAEKDIQQVREFSRAAGKPPYW